MRIKILIAEPWDFTSTDGENILFGEANLQDSGKGKYGEWLIIKCTAFVVAHYSITSLLLSARHKRGELVKDLSAGKMVAVNAYWCKGGLPWNTTLVSMLEQDPGMAGGFLIADVVQVAN